MYADIDILLAINVVQHLLGKNDFWNFNIINYKQTKLRTTGSIKAGLYVWKVFPFPFDTLMCCIINLGMRLLEREPMWNCIFKYFGRYWKTMVWFFLKKQKNKQTTFLEEQSWTGDQRIPSSNGVF